MSNLDATQDLPVIKKKSNRSKNSKKQKKRLNPWLIVAGVVVVIGILLGTLGFSVYKDAKYMKNQANEMKAQLKYTIEDIKNQDIEAATIAMNNVMDINSGLKEKLDSPLWKMARILPKAGENLTSVRALLDVVDLANDDLIQPLIAQSVNYPLGQLKTEAGFNIPLINSYLDFAETLMPKVKEISDAMTDVTDLSMVDKDGKIMEMKGSLDAVSDHYAEIENYIPMMKAVLGNGENRLFAIIAQNTSEMRAGGGFPGSVGNLSIVDGKMEVGNFKTVYNSMTVGLPYGTSITAQESSMFNGSFDIAMGATFNPDFRRAGEIVAASYDAYNRTNVDGVISMTPSIIQRLLAMTGPVTLSDGTTIDGTNATKVLQYDLYYKYLGANATAAGNDIADALFSETAKLAMESFTNSFTLSNIQNYIDLFVECSKDRTIMIYMKDETGEQAIINAGFSGTINPGYNNAVAGAFYGIHDACKKGWFVDITPEIGASTKNEDGTTTYDVSVTLNNVITQKDISNAGEYILGIGPTIPGYVHLTAPVGASISDISTSNGMYMNVVEYLGVQVAYNITCPLYQQTPVTISYKITTAADVTDPLTFVTTPTLTQYR